MSDVIKLSDIVKSNLSNLLNEGRLEDVKAKYQEDQHRMVDFLSKNDPSGNNKYLDWLAKNLINKSGYYWQRTDWRHSPTEVIEALRDFHNGSHKYEKKDIYQYNNVKELLDAYEVAKTKVSKSQLKKEGGEKVYDDENFTLIHPRTHEASCKYGSKTRWCVTMRDYTGYFERYSVNGPLFFLIDKRRMSPYGLPQSMQKAPDYYKVALHYQPKFGYSSLSDLSQAKEYAMKMSRDEFINTANRNNARLDYWNVKDKKVSENIVKKYLGGPGRGQSQRGEATLNAFKNVMESYTKKILGDFWDLVRSKVDDIESYKTQMEELENNREKYRKARNYYNTLSNRLDYLSYEYGRTIDRIGDEYGTPSDWGEEEEQLVDVEELETKRDLYKQKSELAIEKYNKYDRLMGEVDGKIEELKNKDELPFGFYDVKKDKE